MSSMTNPAAANYRGTGSFLTTPTKKATGGNSGAKNSQSSAQAKANAAEDKLRKSLSGTFGSTIDAYKNMIGWLPNEQGALTDQIGTLADSQKTSINDALGSAMNRYEGYRGEVAGNQKATLQDLADNTRNLFTAGNNYLGARGAGESSATGMYSAALTQQANKQRGDVQNQTNKQYNDINTSQEDTQSKAQQQLDAVETWKTSRVSEVVQQYQDLKRQLTIAKAQADDSKKAALAELDRSLFESAINNLNALNAQANTYKQSVTDAIGQQNTLNQGNLDTINSQVANTASAVQPIAIDLGGGINAQVVPQGDGTAIDSITGIKYMQKYDGTWYQVA